MRAGDPLAEPCNNDYHGQSFSGLWYPPTEFDPKCQTCSVRMMLAQHTHLHLRLGYVCLEPGITGVPGEMVQCSCGSFHH